MSDSPISQGGSVTPGHLSVWVAPGVLEDAGSAAAGVITELGVTKEGGIALGVNNTDVANPSGYVMFGAGVANTGTVTLYANSYGSAPAADLVFNVQGTTYSANPNLNYVTATGSTTPRTLPDRFADLRNVLDFGADPTGATDSEPAVAAAIAALSGNGGVVFFPPGTYLFNSTLTTIASGITLRGSGMGATKIVGALSLAAVVQFGTSSAYVINCAVENITISRATGTPPAGSIGLYWANFNYVSELDTFVENHDFARVLDCIAPGGSYLSIGYRALRPYSANVTTAYYQFAGVAGVFLRDPEMGRNGGELYNPLYACQITGQANDINLFGGDWYLQGPTPNQGALLGFIGYLNTTGVIKLDGISAEDIAYAIISDANTPLISTVSIDNCRISTGTSMFNLNSATQLEQFQINASGIGGDGPNLNLTNVKWFRITGSMIEELTAVGAGTGCDLTVTGCTLGNTSLSGTFGTLTVMGNTVQPGGATFSDTSTATIKAIQGIGTLDGLEIGSVDPKSGVFTSVYVGGVLTSTGNTNVNNGALFLGSNTLAATAYATFNTAAGQQRGSLFETAGVVRWAVVANSTTESGSNAGSDLQINAYSDAGSLLYAPIIIVRSTGQVQFGNAGISIAGSGGPTWTTGSAAPSSTQPVGSLYSRTGGSVGSTLYVSRGGGTWNAVSGV